MKSFVGQDIGKYHIIAQLGEGGMAIVYKALDTTLERYVAIKFIRKEAVAATFHEKILQRFELEAKALARLKHPNIVGIIDYGFYQDSPYIVMDFIPCGAVQPERGIPMNYIQVARLLAPVARALDYAHQRGIIHRDIKPSNILLCETGDPMLSDFGIAKILDIGGDQRLTSTGLAIGTPDYMAPEQWLGKPLPQSDIYGLGIVFYELITGRRPYSAETPPAVMLKQATEPLPDPHQFVPDLPMAVEEVLFKALAKDPANRYPNMAGFASALERLAHGQVAQPVELPTELVGANYPRQTAEPKKILAPVGAQVGIPTLPPVKPTPPAPGLTPVSLPVAPPESAPRQPAVKTAPPAVGRPRRKILPWVLALVILGVAALVFIAVLLSFLFTSISALHATQTAESWKSYQIETQDALTATVGWEAALSETQTTELPPSIIPTPTPAPFLTATLEPTSPTTQTPWPTSSATASPTINSFVASIQNDQTMVLKGPGARYRLVCVLNSGAKVSITGRNADGTWLRLSFAPNDPCYTYQNEKIFPFTTDGEYWIQFSALYYTGNLNEVRIVPTPVMAPPVVLPSRTPTRNSGGGPQPPNY
jgi:serine/threonine protein kinase